MKKCRICESVKLKGNAKYCLKCVREIDKRCNKTVKEVLKGLREGVAEAMVRESKIYRETGFVEPWKRP